jgi:hypothetical protein
MIPILATLALIAAALGLDAWLVRTDATADLVTPRPVRVVQSFVGALAAGRPAVAAELLADADGVRDAQLRALSAELRARHGAYRFADGVQRRSRDEAAVRARVRTERAGTLERPFRLARDPDTRLWRIVDFDLLGPGAR